MFKITMKVDGMACSMCEAHINDAIRKAFPIKKVTSSHSRGTTEILAESLIEEDALRACVNATGYTVTDISSEPYEKKSFSLFRR